MNIPVLKKMRFMRCSPPVEQISLLKLNLMLIHINKAPAMSSEKSVIATSLEVEINFTKNTTVRADPLTNNNIVKSLPICSLGSFREMGIFKDCWLELD